MAINTAAQLAASSSAVYTTNAANAITAALVRPFNDNFISSSILVSMTSSMSVLSSSYAYTASSAVSASIAATASFVNTLTQNLQNTGTNTFHGITILSGSFGLTGSATTMVLPITVASNSASIDCRTGNAFSFTLGAASTTHVAFTNILQGQTGNLIITTAATSTVSFSSNVKQISGSAYTATSGSGQTDLLSFVTAGGVVYVVNSKKFV